MQQTKLSKNSFHSMIFNFSNFWVKFVALSLILNILNILVDKKILLIKIFIRKDCDRGAIEISN